MKWGNHAGKSPRHPTAILPILRLAETVFAFLVLNLRIPSIVLFLQKIIEAQQSRTNKKYLWKIPWLFFTAKTPHNGEPKKVSESILVLCWNIQTAFLPKEQDEQRTKMVYDWNYTQAFDLEVAAEKIKWLK